MRARIGFQQVGFMYGLDIRSQSWTLTPDSGPSDDYKYKTLGPFAGYDFPIMLRVWGVYNPYVHGGDESGDIKLYDGSG